MLIPGVGVRLPPRAPNEKDIRKDVLFLYLIPSTYPEPAGISFPETNHFRKLPLDKYVKSCVPQKGTEGSNPSCSAKKEIPSIRMGFLF